MEGNMSDENGAAAPEFKLLCMCKGFLVVVGKIPTLLKQNVFSQKMVPNLFGKCELSNQLFSFWSDQAVSPAVFPRSTRERST